MCLVNRAKGFISNFKIISYQLVSKALSYFLKNISRESEAENKITTDAVCLFRTMPDIYDRAFL